MTGAVKLPPQGGSPRDVAVAVNQAIDGKLSCAGSATVVSGTNSVTITDDRVASDSSIIVAPTFDLAARAWVTNQNNGSFTINFPSAVSPTQTIKYLVIG